jgi:hypothetical protein
MFRTRTYAAQSATAAPTITFQTGLHCIMWVAFPFVSGFISRALNPQDRLHAIFEGATAPAFLYFMAQDFPL